MAYDIGRLRQQNLMGGYDQLTPGAGMNYMNEDSNPSSPYTPGPGLESVAAQQDSNAILGPDGQPLQEPSPIQAPTIEAPRVDPNTGRTLQDYLKQMNEAYTPDYTSRDRLNTLLNEAPTREAPGWGRTLVAAGMSVKANDPIKTAESVMYAPYMRDVEEWKTRADPYYKAAELENRQNINERTLMANAATAHAAAERTAATERAATARNEVALIRANAENARANKWTVKVVGPDVMAYSPDGQSSRRLGSSGNLTQEEKINLEGGWRVEAARQTGADAMGRTVAAGAEVVNDDTGAGVVNPRDPDAPIRRIPGTTGPVRTPGSRGATTNTLETRRQKQDRMEEAYTAHSSEASKYMKGDGKGGLTWKPRPTPGEGGWFGSGVGAHSEAEAKAYDEYRSAIDPDYKPPVSSSRPAPIGGSNRVPDPNDQTAAGDTGEGGVRPPAPRQPSAAQIQQSAEVKSGKRIMVTGPDGRRATILNTPSEIEAAKRSGFKVGR